MKTSLFRIDVSMPCQRVLGYIGTRRTYGDRRLSVFKLAQSRRALLGTQSIADALNKLWVRGPSKDNGTAHGGRAEEGNVLVVSKLR
jgi:hypothetical protein